METTLKLINQTTMEFSQKVLRPNRPDHDHFPPPDIFTKVIAKAYEMDLFHMLLPESLGGTELNMSALNAALVNICMEDTSLGAILFTHIAAQTLVLNAQAENVLPDPDQSRMEESLLAFQIYHNPLDTLPTLQATVKGGAYWLSGSVDYLVMGHLFRYAVIPAVTSGDSVLTYFLIDLRAEGVTLSEPVLSLGLHACAAVDVELKNVSGQLVGGPGNGKEYFENMVAKMGIAAAAMSLGIMKGSFKEALAYARERSQGGRKIIDWSELKMVMANMAVQLRTAEMLMDQAIHLTETQKQNDAQHALAVQIAVQESACSLTTDGVQVLGGAGYMKDYGQEKRYRDAHQIQTIFGHVPTKKLKLVETIITKFKTGNRLLRG